MLDPRMFERDREADGLQESDLGCHKHIVYLIPFDRSLYGFSLIHHSSIPLSLPHFVILRNARMADPRMFEKNRSDGL